MAVSMPEAPHSVKVLEMRFEGCCGRLNPRECRGRGLRIDVKPHYPHIRAGVLSGHWGIMTYRFGGAARLLLKAALLVPFTWLSKVG